MKILFKLHILLLVSLYSSICVCVEAQEVKQPLDNMREFMVSENYGTIRDSYFAGNNHGIVINIQDLHCNYDAQMSIYHIIDELIDKYGLKLVTVEGSVGRLDTQPAFSQCANDKTKELVAKYFVRRGKVDGSAYAHIMHDGDFAYWGVDDEDMHRENVEAFKVSLDTKSANQRYHDNMKAILQTFKSKVYPKELKELDDNIQAYKKDELGFSEYVAYLNGLMDKYSLERKDYTNFARLTEVLHKEAEISFLEVDTERSEYMDKLGEELGKESLSELLDKSLYFKLGKMGAISFYTYLEALSSTKDVTPITDYPQLARYVEYIRLYSDIENMKLFKEIEAIEKALKEKLFTDDIQRKVDGVSHNLEILNDLFNLKLTTRTLQYYRDHRKEFSASNFINFISENAPKYGIRYKLDPSFRKIDPELPSLERFYQLAEERDVILIENTINRMRLENTNLAVLISGGFHTDGITRYLKQKDLSYVVITPKVESLQEDNPYISVLLGENSPFEEILYKMGKKE